MWKVMLSRDKGQEFENKEDALRLACSLAFERLPETGRKGIVFAEGVFADGGRFVAFLAANELDAEGPEWWLSALVGEVTDIEVEAMMLEVGKDKIEGVLRNETPN